MMNLTEAKQSPQVTSDSASLDSIRLPAFDKNIEVIEAYRERLAARALRLTKGNKDLAEDLTQETLLKCMKKIDTPKGEEIILYWLYRCLSNNFISHTRSHNTKKSIATDLTQLDLKDKTDYQEKLLSSLDKQILDYFNDSRINERDQRLLIAYYLEDKTTREIATSLKLPYTAVKTRMARAKNKLKLLIQRDKEIRAEEEQKLFRQR